MCAPRSAAPRATSAQQRAVVPGADVGEPAAAQAAAASPRRPSGCRPGRGPAGPGCGRPAGRRRTAPGRRGAGHRAGAAGRAAAPRSARPAGTGATWAPTQASSVSPPVSVGGGCRGRAARLVARAPPSGAVCDAGHGARSARWAHGRSPRLSSTGGGAGSASPVRCTARCSVAPDGNARVWRTSHMTSPTRRPIEAGS